MSPRIFSLVLIMSLFSGSAYSQTSAPRGKGMNPDISANFLGYVSKSSRPTTDRTQFPKDGASFQEAELQFFSDIDPYLRGQALFSISPNEGEFAIEPEEIFLETISVPNVTLKAGKFKTAMGRHNLLHTHAYPFIDAPLINQKLLGDEGLNEVGVSAATLIPASWFMELTLQGISNSNETLYNSPSSADYAGVAALKNLWDLSEDWTLEWSAYGTLGKNAFDGHSGAYGSDLIFKWRPSEGGKYHALIWANQFLGGNRTHNPEGEHLNGLATWLQYQFAQRWWVQGRFERLGVGSSEEIIPQNKQSALVGFFPSEFSGFRVQFDRLTQNDSPNAYNGALQYTFTIGAHPAHSY